VLLCVGSGPLQCDLETTASRLGIADRVIFTGERTDVPDILGVSDVVVLASRREGVPRVVMEAMAAGRPVVATNVVGTRSIVQDGLNGLLVPLGDPDSLATALATLLRDEQLRRRLALQASRDVATHWTHTAVAQRTSDIYEILLERNRRHPGSS